MRLRDSAPCVQAGRPGARDSARPPAIVREKGVIPAWVRNRDQSGPFARPELATHVTRGGPRGESASSLNGSSRRASSATNRAADR